MGDLKTKICELIALQGPMRVSTFMTLALGDEQNGYYKNATPFGKEGDFITAPEISQMFGELIGIWVIETFNTLNKPSSFSLCELGPGRGTLMQDLLRTIKKLSVECFQAANVVMVETSDKLIQQQKQALSAYRDKIRWLKDFDKLPAAPLILVANEFLDALPIDQFIKIDGQWHERLIATDDNDQLGFAVGNNVLDQTGLPKKYQDLPEGSVLELSPARLQFVEQVLKHLSRYHGSALFIDYGSTGLPYGDTLQAISRHAFSNIFANPGKDDLTSHVDFSSLEVIAERQGILSGVITQGAFLTGMGLIERAGQLGANKGTAVQEKIRSVVERLAAPNEMGTLFKVLCLSDKKTGLHRLFTAGNTSHN